MGTRRRGDGVESDIRRRGTRPGPGRGSVLALSPQGKGAIENLVGWVKGSFFKQRRFLDREDLERQLREWRTEGDTGRPSPGTGRPPAARVGEGPARVPALDTA